jgi:transcriptional regulator with XRE-family HTH domain
MNADDLRAVLAELELSQADFARLTNVTPRAVALWAADERAIPGPVEGYLRLLRLLPLNLRQTELNRLKQKGTGMRDGMFGISYQGQQGSGMGVIILDNGRVYGTDVGGVRYDGEYLFDELTGLATVKMKITFPPNIPSVFGISNPYEWAFDLTTSFNPRQNSGQLSLMTSIGKSISAQFAFLRSLPDAA